MKAMADKRRHDWTHLNEHNVDDAIFVELLQGVDKFGKYNSMHEAYAVIKEELEEFWDSIKRNDPDPYELVQVCAVAKRALLELCITAREEAADADSH